MKKLKYIISGIVIAALAAVVIFFAFARSGQNVSLGSPGETPPPASTEPVTEVTMVVTEDSIKELETNPHLRRADLSGSLCYAAIEEYAAAHPEVEVIYTVALGSGSYDHAVSALELPAGSYTVGDLLDNLAHFPALESLSLPCTPISAADMEALSAAYPELALSFSVEIAGDEYSSDTAALDLNSLSSADAETAAAALSLLPGVESIDLSRSSLSPAEVAPIRAAAPEAAIDYSFELFGKTISLLSDTNIEYLDQEEIGNAGETAIREALSILPAGSRIVFDDCGLDNEVMASIRDDYPEHKVVWRVHFGYFSMLTDEETIRAIFDLTDDIVDDLKYCTEVKYMDIGHNTELTNVDFIAYMTKLEICIMSGSPFSNMEVFGNCPNLDWLELVYCPNVEDISSLANCKNLRYLNLTYTKVTDITPLDGLPLERFFYANPKLDDEQMAHLKEEHADCWLTFEGFEYGYGWRYDDPGTTVFGEPYLKVREVFRYGENYYNHK